MYVYSLELVTCSLSGREVVHGLCMNEALLGGRACKPYPSISRSEVNNHGRPWVLTLLAKVIKSTEESTRNASDNERNVQGSQVKWFVL